MKLRYPDNPHDSRPADIQNSVILFPLFPRQNETFRLPLKAFVIGYGFTPQSLFPTVIRLRGRLLIHGCRCRLRFLVHIIADSWIQQK